MSTVVWEEGKIYADTRMTSFKNVHSGTREVESINDNGNKVFRNDSAIYGVTGSLIGAEDFFDWTIAGRPCRFLWPSPEVINGRVAYPVTVYEWDGETLNIWWNATHSFELMGRTIVYASWWRKHKVKNPMRVWHTMGSGEDFAMEALESGLLPAEAIQYASDRDDGTNDRVVVLSADDIPNNYRLPDNWLDRFCHKFNRFKDWVRSIWDESSSVNMILIQSSGN